MKKRDREPTASSTDPAISDPTTAATRQLSRRSFIADRGCGRRAAVATPGARGLGSHRDRTDLPGRLARGRASARTWSSSARGWPAWPPPATSCATGTPWSCSRRATASAGGRSTSRSPGRSRRGRRPVDWPDPEPPRRPGQERRGRHVRDLQHGPEPLPPQRATGPLHAARPARRAAAARRVRPRSSPSSTRWPRSSRSRRRGRRPTPREWDGQTFETWKLANSTLPDARFLLDLGTEAVLAAEPRDVSLLHYLFYTAARATRATPD